MESNIEAIATSLDETLNIVLNNTEWDTKWTKSNGDKMI